MDKSPEAFRTISEVAEALETPAHVLRFWESRFPQIKPVKRAGGRRYYRPADVALLGGIRHLLHDEGMTIRGVQKILREQGVRHVAAMAAGSEDIDFEADHLDSDTEGFVMTEPEVEAAQVEASQVVALEPVKRSSSPQSTPAEVVQLRAVPESSAIKPTLPPEEVPEAGHIWVEDEPEMDLGSPIPLFAESPGDGVPEPGMPLTPAAPVGSVPIPPAEQGRRVSGHVEPGKPADLSGGFVVSGTGRPSGHSDGIAMTQGRQRPAVGAQMVMPDLAPSAPDTVDSVGDDPTGTEQAQPVSDAAATGSVAIAQPTTEAGADIMPEAGADTIPEAGADTTPEGGAFMDNAPAVLLPALSGIAARLRALHRPIYADRASELTELHSRLGLLLAQMAEAQHQKR